MKNHYKETGLDLEKLYFISMGLLGIYGIYKNGLMYLFHGMIPFLEFLHLVLLYGAGLSIGLLFDFKVNKKVGEYTLYTMLFTLLLPYQTQPLFYSIYLLISCFLILKLKKIFNPTLIFYVIFVLVFRPSYANYVEANMPMFYGIINTFLGRSIGGVGSTNILLMIISWIFFQTKLYYKKEIPIISLGTFSILTLIYNLVTANSNLIINLLNSTVYFVSIYLLPQNRYSPLKKNNQYIYAFLAGLLMFLCSLGNSNPFMIILGGVMAHLIGQIGQILSKKAK